MTKTKKIIVLDESSDSGSEIDFALPPKTRRNFYFDGSVYRFFQPTKGDGACALHALNGEVKDGVWQQVPGNNERGDPGVLAKQDFLLKVENNKNCVLYAECVAEYILMDAALSKKRDLFVTKAGAEVEAAAQQRISRLLSMIEEGLIGEDILKVLQESKHAYRGCSPSEFRELIGRDREACTNAFQATQSQLQPMLEKQDSSFLGLQQQWETGRRVPARGSQVLYAC